jgi:hypothetical protein
MFYTRVFSKLFLANVLGLSALLLASGAWAGNPPPKTLIGKIVVLNQSPPEKFPSNTAFTKFIRTNSINEVSPNDKGNWEFQTMAFFDQPLNDFEVELIFYDITEGSSVDMRRYVNSYTMYTRDHSAQTLAGKTKLIRPDFHANRTYMIVAKSRGFELARGEFSTVGLSEEEGDAESSSTQKQEGENASMKVSEKKPNPKKIAEQERRQEEDNTTAEKIF